MTSEDVTPRLLKIMEEKDGMHFPFKI